MNKQFTWYRDWLAWFLGFVLLFRLASVVALAKDIGQPFGGYLTYYNIIATRIGMCRDTPPWWPGLAPGRLKVDDRLLEIDGWPYDLYHEKLAFTQAAATGQKQVTLLIKRHLNDQGGYDPPAPRRRLEISIPVTRFTWQQCFDLAFPILLAAICLWILAATVYITHPTISLNRFMAVAFALAALASQNRHALFWFGDWAGRMIDVSASTAFVLTSALLFHAALRFPTPLLPKSRLRWVIIPLYGLAGGLITMYLTSRFLLWSREPITLAVHSDTIQQIIRYLDARAFYGMFRFQTAAFFVFSLRLGMESIHPRTERRQRREAFVLLIGLTVTWAALTLRSLGPLHLGTTVNFWQYFDLRYGVLALPIAATFVTLRYQTLHRAPPALLLVLMLAVSGLVSSLGTALLCAWSPTSCPATMAPLFLLMFSIALISALAWTLGTSWRGWFGRLLHRQRSNYAAVRVFGQQLLQERDWTLETLPPALAQSLCHDLELEQSAIWLWDADMRRLQLAGTSGTWPIPLPEHLTPTGEQEMPPRPLPLRLARPPAPPWLQSLPPPCQVAVPLSLSGEPVGLLGLGKRWDERALNEEDLEIFDLIGQQTTLLLVTTRQIVEIRRMPMQIVEAQERERARLAREIHDTTQQFLNRLPLTLQKIYEQIEYNPQAAQSILLDHIADSAQESATLRHILHNLSPIHLDTDFVQAVRQLIHRFQIQAGIPAQLTIAPNLEDLPLDTRHAMYRVLQQALDNVALHAHARRVEITLLRNDGHLEFRIRDDGVGCDAEQARSGFGLRSMEARIQSLGGDLRLRPIPGGGMTVEGQVPLTNGRRHIADL